MTIEKKIVPICSVCNAVELDGKIVPEFAPGNMGIEDYALTHGILSYGCLEKQYGTAMAKQIAGSDDSFKIEKCDTLEDFYLKSGLEV